MNNIIRTIEFHKGDTQHFLQSITYGGELFSVLNNHFVFRGHSSSNYKLVPAAFRNDELIGTKALKNNQDTNKISELLQIHLEKVLLQEFYKKCDDAGLYLPYIKRENCEFFLNSAIDNSTFPDFDYWIPEDLYELAALAQHYGVPTRLLDWSRDINVAIYFAMSDYLQSKKDIEEKDYMTIWALDGGLLNRRVDECPLKLIKPRYHFNPYLQAQRGVFTLWQVKRDEVLTSSPQTPNKINVVVNKEINDMSLEKLLQRHLDRNPNNYEEKIYLYQINIYDIKEQIPILYSYLERMRVTAQYLFPGYKGIEREIKEKRVLKKIII